MSTPAATYGAMLAGVDYVLVGCGHPGRVPGALWTLWQPDGPAGSTSTWWVRAPLRLGGGPARSGGGCPGANWDGPSSSPSSPPTCWLPTLPVTPPPAPTALWSRAPWRAATVPRRGARLSWTRRASRFTAFVTWPTSTRWRPSGLPYWLAGGYASPALLAEALRAGAAGVQVGSAFALCEESGLLASIKRAAIEHALAADLPVRADPRSSPTGFPFKLADLPGTVAEAQVYESRERVCDVGYLRAVYVKPGTEIGYRCPAEPVPTYLRKGGKMAETVGRCCLCNGLIAAIGLGQRRRHGTVEPPIVTLGQDLSFLPELLSPGRQSYTAADVVAYLAP